MVLLELDRNLFPTATAASHLPVQEGKEVKEPVSETPGPMGLSDFSLHPQELQYMYEIDFSKVLLLYIFVF